MENATWQKVGMGSFTYVKYKEAKPGDTLAVGYYLGTKQGNYGLQHLVRTDSGNTVVLNSSGQLNYLFENNIAKGDYVRVDYAGEEVLKKGKFKGKSVHTFDMMVDKKKTGGAELLTNSDTTAEVADSGYAWEPDAEEGTEEVTAAPPPTATKTSPADLMAKYRKAT